MTKEQDQQWISVNNIPSQSPHQPRKLRPQEVEDERLRNLAFSSPPRTSKLKPFHFKENCTWFERIRIWLSGESHGRYYRPE